jgi:hypothetical protein
MADDILIELISITSIERYHKLISKTPVNAYILLGLKILNQGNIDRSKRDMIEK